MGASGWDYIVPYEEDLQQALDHLRQDIFSKGKYYKGWDWKPGATPSSIKELMEWNGEEGSHSILDTERVSNVPDYFVVAPLTDTELNEFLGSTQPTLDIVKANLDKIRHLRSRWMGTYVIIYENGKPHEILSTGFSGD